MNQLSTVLRTHLIIFHDKAKKWITEQQFNQLLELGGSEARGLKVDGSYITFASIAKLLSKEEYYEQYPNERPENRERVEYVSIQRTIESHQKHFRSLLEGLKQYIDEQIGTGANPINALNTYNKKLQTYKELFGKGGPALSPQTTSSVSGFERIGSVMAK